MRQCSDWIILIHHLVYARTSVRLQLWQDIRLTSIVTVTMNLKHMFKLTNQPTTLCRHVLSVQSLSIPPVTNMIAISTSHCIPVATLTASRQPSCRCHKMWSIEYTLLPNEIPRALTSETDIRILLTPTLSKSMHHIVLAMTTTSIAFLSTTVVSPFTRLTINRSPSWQ